VSAILLGPLAKATPPAKHRRRRLRAIEETPSEFFAWVDHRASLSPGPAALEKTPVEHDGNESAEIEEQGFRVFLESCDKPRSGPSSVAMAELAKLPRTRASRRTHEPATAQLEFLGDYPGDFRYDGRQTANLVCAAMNRRHTDNEDEDWDEDGDYEAFDGYDSQIDEDAPTVPCPYCRREIHEDANQCPYCGQYVSREDAPRQPKPWWLIVGVVVCLYLIWRWLW
jgi:hypothetical protein